MYLVAHFKTVMPKTSARECRAMVDVWLNTYLHCRAIHDRARGKKGIN